MITFELQLDTLLLLTQPPPAILFYKPTFNSQQQPKVTE